MNAENAALLLARRAQARTSLYWFSRYGFLQQRGYKWQRNWHHELICQKLQDVFEGRCKRLIINIPPRFSKTELAVVNFIAWALGQRPDSEFIHVSYGARLAANNSARARDIVRTVSPSLFQRIRLAKHAVLGMSRTVRRGSLPPTVAGSAAPAGE